MRHSDPDEAPAGTRFILYRRPDPQAEEAQRRHHRFGWWNDVFFWAIMIFVVGIAIGGIVTDLRSGDPGAVVDDALIGLFAAIAAFLSLMGGVGLRGRFHQFNASMCALTLEEEQRASHYYGMRHAPIDGVRAENVAEYLRLLKVAEDGSEYLDAVADRIRSLKGEDGGPWEPVEAEPDEVVNDDHVK